MARPRLLIVLLSALVIVAPGVGAQQKPAPQAPPAARGPEALEKWNDALEALTKKVWPSVVQILVSAYGARERTAGEAAVVGPQRSTGSGFVIDPEGYIITNAHVVSGALRVQVVLPPANADGTLATALSGRMTIVPAKLVGISTEIDLALLKVDGLKLPALPLATYSEMHQGETVFAFGSPSGLRNTLTHGLVSAVARQIDPDSPLIYVQTDAPINPGNSGGPLVNIRGEVVGVNTFILSQSGGNEGLGFAIPVATTRTVFRQLKQYGHLRRQEVGISLQTITPDLAAGLALSRDYGVIISDVWPGGPAETAGLKAGDVIVSVDGQAYDNLPSVNYYFRLRDSDEKVRIVVLRGTSQFSFAVQAVEDRSQLDAVTAPPDPEISMVRDLGILGVEITPEIAASAKGLRNAYGVVVVARVAGSGGEVPLQVRDIIVGLNGQPVTSLQRLRDGIRALKPGASVALQIQRETRLLFVSFTIN